jgi:hypothetical protein
MSSTQTITLPQPQRLSPGILAMKAALSTIVQRRNGAREPARDLYYSAHSLLRALRSHLGGAQ